jgi:hypothetical protein
MSPNQVAHAVSTQDLFGLGRIVVVELYDISCMYVQYVLYLCYAQPCHGARSCEAHVLYV